MAETDLEARRRELRDKGAKLLVADHFAALGVTRTASTDEVKKAYIELVKAWHPDRVPAGLEDLKPLFAEVFARLDAARSTLTDPSLRLDYAGKLAKGVIGGGPAGFSGTAGEATLELRKAEALLKKNDVAGAEKHARRAVQLDPTNVELLAFVVTIQALDAGLSLERMRQLVAELDALVKRDDKCERAYVCRAQLRKRLDMPKEAAADFAKAAELNPRNLDAAREVRLYQMRKEKAESPDKPRPAPKHPGATAEDQEGGVGGFFKKLFKR